MIIFAIQRECEQTKTSVMGSHRHQLNPESNNIKEYQNAILKLK